MEIFIFQSSIAKMNNKEKHDVEESLVGITSVKFSFKLCCVLQRTDTNRDMDTNTDMAIQTRIVCHCFTGCLYLNIWIFPLPIEENVDGKGLFNGLLSVSLFK